MIKENNKVNMNKILNIPNWEEIPNTGIYSNKVIEIINRYLTPIDKYKNMIDLEESYITQTMINNYVKNKMLEAPENRKYYRRHIAHLLIISILKQIYKAEDIKDMFEITYKLSDVKTAFNIFKEVFTHSLESVYNGKEIDGNLKMCMEKKERYLLKNIADSIAKKIYADNLRKEITKKISEKKK